METIDLELLKKKSVAGIVALTSRTFVLQIIAFSSTFLLTIFLAPTVFGIFYVVSAIIAFLAYFSDIGLAAALIQKKAELTREDLTTTFTIQQILVLMMVVIALIFSRQIALFYRLDEPGLWLFRALVFSFFLSSLKTIPSVILERKLEFQKLVIPQILETSGFYLVAVVLAWRGLGVASFTWAVLTRAVLGVTAMYWVSPWKIELGLAGGAARKLLRFGVPFQLNSFLALIKDDLLTIFLGKILPFAEVGYIGWAKKWAEVPLRLIMDSVVRVTFPAFARLQHAPTMLGRAIEKTLFGLGLVIFPITVGLLFYITPLVALIPRYNKWEPALTSFYLLAVTSAIAGLSVPLTNALNAVGKIKITLYLMVMWTTATWILTVVLISWFGFNGVAAVMLLVASSIVIVVALVKKVAPFAFVRSILYPLLGATVMFLWYALWRSGPPYHLGKMLLVGISGVILYIGVLTLMEKEKIRSLFRDFLNPK